jgi:hypothetical protein
MDDTKENISIEQLSKIENLSVRSTNVCEWNGLKDLTAILSYYGENNNFLSLRNCGQKSNIELIKLCKRNENFLIKAIKTVTENPLQKQLEILTARQKQILNNVINSQLKELSKRANNAIKVFANSDASLKSLYEIIINPNFDIKNFRNVGGKTEEELKDFFKNLRDQLELISVFNDEKELTIELFSTYLKRKFDVEQDVLKEIFNNYNLENRLPLFKALLVLINRELVFTNKEKEVFEKGLNFWQENNAKTLEEIAVICNVTKERMRQIKNRLLDELREKFAFIKGFELEAINLYGIDFTNDFILLTEELVCEINEKEKNTFNHLFINLIFSILFEDSLKIVGNIESAIFNSAKARGVQHNWCSTYLIKNELFNLYDFEAFVNDIDKRLSERIEEDYSFHFETYLHKFLKVEYSGDLMSIIPIAEHILYNEFVLTLDRYEQITFKRNTKKQVFEYVYDILGDKNEPLTVYQIYEILNANFPDVTKNAKALRGSCQRAPNLIYFGRSSTYGLKNWEDNESIKGGTIRSITEEYLLNFNSPKHIFEITEHINRFRDTNAKNIHANLKLDESGTFELFPQSFVGLKIKSKYPEYQKYYTIPRFLGKSIMAFLRNKEQLFINDLINFVSSNTNLSSDDALLVIRQLEVDKYLIIENSTVVNNGKY